MSHTVLRGEPTAAQLYLDKVIEEFLQQQGMKPDVQQRNNVTLTQVLFHCLKKRPDAVFMTNGATGEITTNRELLERAVSLARALVAANARGKLVMLLMRNHQHMMAVYYAVLFAGVVPFCMDPNTTAYELTHFLELVEPSYMFYDREHDKVLHEALSNTRSNPILYIVDEPEHLVTFVDGFSKDFETYQLPNASPDDTIILLPTSGSTGLPKAAELTQRGLVIQLPTPWCHHTKFPTPTELVMILTSNQWMTFTMMTTSCIVYHVPILISPKLNTVESVTELLENYRPTWTFFAPAFVSALLPTIRPDQLNSLETLILLGAPSTPELKGAVKAKLSEKTHLSDGYGTTETQGFIALPDKDAPVTSNGRVVNCLHYKIIDEFGQELGLNQTGELCVKGPCIIKVAPEEVERVISSVAGVHECVVCASEYGPAAAVVLHSDVAVTKENIHKAVNTSLSDHKRLHGGIVFVPSLPHTHSGKLNRAECTQIISRAVDAGECS